MVISKQSLFPVLLTSSLIVLYFMLYWLVYLLINDVARFINSWVALILGWYFNPLLWILIHHMYYKMRLRRQNWSIT